MMIAARTIAAAGLSACLLGLTGCGGDSLSAAAPIAAEPVAGATDSQWRLVWSDEFDGGSIDLSKWGFDIDCWGGGNQEQQCYTDSRRNADVAGGMLIITALHEQATGLALPLHMRASADNPAELATKPFTSARLTTRGKASWRYGRIEVRARLPQGQGTWPAIWMLPDTDTYGSWARSGEIDVMEAVNLGTSCPQCPTGREDTILGTLHFGGAWPDNSLASTEIHYPAVLDGFHTFGVIWREGHFTWTVDGQSFATKQAEDWFTTGSSAANAPFDENFHLILNLAIGGGLAEGRGEGGVSTTGFPKRLEIDWVHVWQCDADPASANGCEPEGN